MERWAGHDRQGRARPASLPVTVIEWVSRTMCSWQAISQQACLEQEHAGMGHGSSWVVPPPWQGEGGRRGGVERGGGSCPPPPHGRTKHKLSCHFLAKIFVAEGSPPGSFLLGIAPRSQNTKCSPTPTPTLTILVKKSLFDRPTSVIMRALRWHGVGHGPIVCRGRVGGRRGAGSGARPFTLSF